MDIKDLADAIDSHEVWQVVTVVLSGFLEPLPLACLIIGTVLFFLWLFFLSWQTCIGMCRKACCCIASKKRNISWMFLLCTAIIGGFLSAGSIYMITFGQIGTQKSVNAIGSSTCAALDIVETTEWGTQSDRMSDATEHGAGTYLVPGLMGTNSKNSPGFVGIRGLVRNLNGLKALTSSENEDNAVELTKRFLQGNQDLSSSLEPINNSNYALVNNLNTFKVQTEMYQMKSLFVEAMATLGDDFYKPFLAASNDYSNRIDAAMQGVTLPEIDLSDSLGLEDLEAGTSQLQEFATEVTRVVTPAASLVPIALWSEITFMFTGIVIAVVALAVFFVTKGRRNTCLSGVTWNWLLITVSLSLITTAAVLLASSVGAPLCDAGVKTLWPAKADAYDDDGDADWQLDRLTTSLLGDQGAVLAECMRKPNYNFLEAWGLQLQFDEAKSALERTHYDVINSIPSYSSLPAASTSTFANSTCVELGQL